MDPEPRITFECPQCESKDVRYPDMPLSNDLATCADCGRIYAYGDMLEAVSRRVMTMMAAERRASERILAAVKRVGIGWFDTTH